MDTKSVPETVNVLDSVKVIKRINLSPYHLWSADHFASSSADIERINASSQPSEETTYLHRTYVTNSIFSAFAFLESIINELFADSIDNNSWLASLGSTTLKEMKFMWQLKNRRVSTLPCLDKFNLALELFNREPFVHKKPPYQNVDYLRELRNHLVHYQPEWATEVATTDSAISKKLEEKLVGYNFSLHPFAVKADPFFPNKCLGYDCAKWAVKSSLEFADEFFRRLGLKPPYDDLRSKLNLK